MEVKSQTFILVLSQSKGLGTESRVNEVVRVERYQLIETSLTNFDDIRSLKIPNPKILSNLTYWEICVLKV